MPTRKFFLLVLAGLMIALLPLSTGAQTAVNTETKPAVTTDDACNLSTPASFTYTKPSATSALLDWSAVAGASAYHLKVYELATLSTASETNESGTSKLITNLDPTKTYRCELSCICANREASASIIIIDVIER